MKESLPDKYLKSTIPIVETAIKDYSGEYSKEFHEFLEKDGASVRLLIRELSNHVWQDPRNENLFTGPLDVDFPAPTIAGLVWTHLSTTLRNSSVVLDRLKEEFRAGSALLIVGAGISFDSGFNWVTVQRCLRRCFPRENLDPVFELDQRGGPLWQRLRDEKLEGEDKVVVFRRHLSAEVRRMDPKQAHRHIKDFLERGKVLHVVCFNWDDFIERDSPFIQERTVYCNEQPRFSETPLLWKPHGCVTKMGPQRFRLPDEGISLSPHAISTIKRTPGSLVPITMGFSGSSYFSANELRGIINGTWPIFDVRPVAMPNTKMGDIMISLGATYVLEQLSAGLE